MSGTGEEEDLAAAWGAALEEESSTEAQAAPAVAADAARVLNQAAPRVRPRKAASSGSFPLA
jgi:hypothetical protein